MQLFKRIFLFLALNIVICATIITIATIFKIDLYFSHKNFDMKNLFFVSFLYGMIGSLISLLLSKPMAKSLLGVKIINPYDCSNEGLLIKKIVAKVSAKAGLKTIPEIGIFQNDAPNAFATGFSAKNALVAVSTGLINKLDEEEIEAVVGHEIAHITNGDMVTMTLLQGVINTFVIFLSYVLAHLVTAMFRKDRQKDSDTFVFYILRQVFQILFMIVGSLIICSYSRYREYKADLGGAKLSSFDKMIRALKRLDTISTRKEEQSPQSLAALMFTQKTSAQELFSTHPTLEKRIAALQAAAV